MTGTSGVLNIVSARCLPVRLDFKMDVSHNLATRHFTENIIVEMSSDSPLRGYGECVPRKYVTGETPESVLETLGTVLPSLEGKRFSSPGEVTSFLQDIGKSETMMCNPAAQCALELALLDIAGKTWSVPVSDFICTEKNNRPLIYSLIVPLLKNNKLDSFLARAKNFGFTQVKVKVDADNPSARVRRVRNVLGDTVEIRTDANCSWNRENAPVFMRELADLGVVSIEQPLPAEDLEGSTMLRNTGIMLVTLDESVTSVNDVNRCISLGACDVFNIRISKCGGIMNARRMIDAAVQKGLKIQLGAHVGESCILSAAGAQLASSIPYFVWLEGCFGKYLLQKDLCDEDVQFGKGGLLYPPEGPGLGIKMNKSLLEEANKLYTEQKRFHRHS